METFLANKVFVIQLSQGAPTRRIYFTCDYCRILSYDRPSHYALKARHFCEQECYSRFRQERMLSSEQPTWRGGVAKATQVGRGNKRYKEWQLAVFTRDGFRCVWCGSETDLEADHIKRWADYPTLRYDISNGRTLCQPCHNKTRGRSNENPELLNPKVA